MIFAQPAYLYGLLALAIPIIIHLFNFRRTKRVYFSNSRFLQQVKESKSAKRRLKHYLILASRLMFILFLVLAFAQPFIPSDEIDQQNERVYIYLDNSLSMDNEVASSLSGLDVAVQGVQRILDLYPREARFKLITNNFNAPIKVFRTKEEILDQITEIELNGVPRSFEQVWQRLNSDDAVQSADWYFISDFQKSTFADLQGFQADSTQRLVLVPVTFQSTANLFIDSVYLKNPFLIANDQNTIELQMRNTGSEEVRDLVVSLSVNDKQIANTGIDIPGNGTATAQINLNVPFDGNNPARLSFEEFPVAFDNDFYFNLNLSQRISILEISDQQQASVVAKVYANPELFDFRHNHIDNLDYSQVDEMDLVLLNAIDEVPPSLLDLLQTRANKGQHLVVIPSRNQNLASIQRLVPFANAQLSTDTTWLDLEAPRVNLPFFQNIFEQQDQQAISMPRVKNNLVWSPQRGTNLLVSKSGIPYLSSSYGGNVYLIASELDPDFSTLAQHALFVPIMYKVAALSKAYDRDLYYTTDQQVVNLTLDSLIDDELFSLSNGSERLIPNQRILGNELILEVPSEIIRPGFYELAANDQVMSILPYNNHPQESLLEQFQPQELVEMFPQDYVRVLDADQFADFTNRVVQARSGLPLWKYALMLALLFLMIEVLLIRFLK